MNKHLNRLRRFTAGFALLLIAGTSWAQTSQLLKDISPGTTSSNATFGPGLNGMAIFAADGALWRSDGTAAGTQRLGEGMPLNVGNGPVGVQLGDALIYTGYAASSTAELWRTDGTVAGSYLLLDLHVVPSGFGSIPGGSNPASCGAGFVVMGNQAYYGAAATGASKLFRTDGTIAGTIEIGSFPSSVCALAASGGSVYFQAYDGQSLEPQLWRSNGQPGGNEQVRDDTGAPLPAPLHMIEMGGSLYFFVRVRSEAGLWRLTPGDPIARLVLARTWSNFNSVPITNAVIGNTLLFRDAEVVNGSIAARLYRTDGTTSGTYALSPIEGASSPRPIGAPLGGRFFYSGPVDLTSFDLWVTDGTTAGTTSVRIPLPSYQTLIAPDFFVFNGQMHFMALRPISGVFHTELWRTDGTSAGTVHITEVPLISRATRGAHYAVAGSRLLFLGESDTYGEEPWFYDPTSSGGGGGSNGGSGGGGGNSSGGGTMLWPELLALGLMFARRGSPTSRA